MIATKWPLVRVTAMHLGADGKVGVVTMQTKKGPTNTHITKIVPLIHET